MKKILYLTIVIILFSSNLSAQRKFNINEYRAEENFKKGVYYFNETKFLSSIEFFIKALQYNPDFYKAKLWLGKSYYKAGYKGNAIDEWLEVVENGGADNISINRLNRIFFRIGHLKKLKFIDSYIHLKTINGNRWDSRRFLQPITLLMNRDQEVFITGLASRSILHLDPNYNLIKKISSGIKSFKMPYGFALDSMNNMIISDVKRDIIQKLDKDGKSLFMIGGTGIADGKMVGPESVCVDRNDNIYVVDTGNSRVQKFSPDGKLLMKFGERGSNPGEFYRPTGITLDEENNIYISDHVNKNIQKFDEDGNFLEYVFEDKPFNDLRNIRKQGDHFLIADGVSGGYIYNYDNGTWTHFKDFTYGQSKMLSVSDMILAHDHLYISDLYKNTVEVFAPDTYKYSNLDVEIDTVDTAKYPRIVLYCSVYKQDGSPVIGLSRDNFNIKELGVRIYPYELVTSIYDKKKINTVFLVEKSLSMKKYADDLKEAAEFFIKDIFKTKDTVKVLNFHKSDWVGLDFEYRKLRILEALSENNYHYLTDVSKPLYKSITDVMNKLSRKVVVFFTTGDFDIENNFKSYSWEVCMNYAKANHVPVYIINFTDNNESELRSFAKETGGKYYHFFKDSRRLKNIRPDIASTPVNRYVIVYSTLKDRRLIDSWREINLEVDFNKLTGVDKTGYFVPRH
ncbi:MAG: 6-bladed beta-propeller [Spirochaetes bacterium]|nr:6-bladed beta-propeller [Spirochaetota bacterium]